MGVKNGYVLHTLRRVASIPPGVPINYSRFDRRTSPPVHNLLMTDGIVGGKLDRLYIDFNSLKSYVKYNTYGCVMNQTIDDEPAEYNFFLDENLIELPDFVKQNERQLKFWKILTFKIYTYIQELVRQLKPQKTVFISFEGKKPFSRIFTTKMDRIRKRMLNIIQEDYEKVFGKTDIDITRITDRQLENYIWDGNQNVIDKISFNKIHFKNYLISVLNLKLVFKNDLGENIEVILSTHPVDVGDIIVDENGFFDPPVDRNDNGEGEYKIMNHIRGLGTNNENIVIYGCDTDLINLSLLIHQHNIFLIKEVKDHHPFGKNHYILDSRNRGYMPIGENFTGENKLRLYYLSIRNISYYLFIDIFCLIKKTISQKLVNSIIRNSVKQIAKYQWYLHCSEYISHKRIIDDFVVLCFFYGNDFLMPLPCLVANENVYAGNNNSVNSLNFLLACYADNLKFSDKGEPSYLYDRENSGIQGNGFNFLALKDLLYLVKKCEYHTLHQLNFMTNEYNDIQTFVITEENRKNKWKEIAFNPVFNHCVVNWDNKFVQRTNLASFYPITYDPNENDGDSVSILSKRFHYKTYFDLDFTGKIDDICRNYVDGLVYLTRYFFHGEIDNGYYYRFPDSPLISDLCYFLNKNYSSLQVDIFNFGVPPTLRYMEYLLLTTNIDELGMFQYPEISREILRQLSLNNNMAKEFRKHYPPVDRIFFNGAGKKYISQIVPKILPIDINLIHELYDEVINVLRRKGNNWDVLRTLEEMY